jgi:hypothetical protein
VLRAFTFEESARNNDPRAAIVPSPPIKEGCYLSRVAVCREITTKAKNSGAVLDKFINTMLDKGEGQKLFSKIVIGDCSART